MIGSDYHDCVHGQPKMPGHLRFQCSRRRGGRRQCCLVAPPRVRWHRSGLRAGASSPPVLPWALRTRLTVAVPPPAQGRGDDGMRERSFRIIGVYPAKPAGQPPCRRRSMRAPRRVPSRPETTVSVALPVPPSARGRAQTRHQRPRSRDRSDVSAPCNAAQVEWTLSRGEVGTDIVNANHTSTCLSARAKAFPIWAGQDRSSSSSPGQEDIGSGAERLITRKVPAPSGYCSASPTAAQSRRHGIPSSTRILSPRSRRGISVVFPHEPPRAFPVAMFGS